MKDTHSSDRRARATGILSKHGYGKMKGVADGEIRKALGQHEAQEHGGKKTKLKLATGGCAMGGEPKSRMDRKARAHGGRNKGHKEPRVSVNVINAGKQPVPVPAPVASGAMNRPPMPMPAPQGQPAPQMGSAPMGAHPPMPGGMPPRQFKAGGPVKNKMDIPHLEGGSGGGMGRLEKAEHEAKRK